MKNVMKNLGFIIGITLVAVIYSCAKDEAVSKSGHITMTKSLTVRGADKTEDFLEDALVIIFYEDQERIVSLDFSEELEALFDEAGYGMDEIQAMIDEEFGGSIYLPFDDIIEAMDAAGKSDESLSDCIKDCIERFEKGKGRGACKAACVGERLLRFVEKLLGIVIGNDEEE